jgi:hypothetical protein
MEKKENGSPSLETLPLDWFPDRAAVREFVKGSRFDALSVLVLGTFAKYVPEPLASSTQDAAFFVGKDLFELARVAAIPGEESFEYSERGRADSGREWHGRLSSLATIALAGNFAEAISHPIVAMQAEATDSNLADRNGQMVDLPVGNTD